MADLGVILPNADGTTFREWVAQGFASIDEGLTSPDGFLIGAGDINNTSVNRNTSLTTSFHLAAMPSGVNGYSEL